MSPRSRRSESAGRWLPLAAVLALSTACATAPASSLRPAPGSPAEPAPTTTRLHVAEQWRSESVVASGGSAAPYDYGPTVLAEAGRYRAWWCSQLPGIGPDGDDVLHAESDDLRGDFATAGGASAVPVFNGRPGGFDAMHTCDPSVLKTGDRYYLYYTGAAGDHAHGNAIGVASGPDGLAWRREAAGEPIVTPSAAVRRSNDYGAGQPSALYLDGWFYLMFTDTTAAGAGWNGAGQFVQRARDPAFTDRVQALTQSGFEPVGPDPRIRGRSVVDAFSADWMWVDALQAFAIAHQTAEGTTITFWDRGFTRHPYEPVVLPGPWQEGPGLVRAADGHAPVSEVDSRGTVPIELLRATTANPAPTGIRSTGVGVSEVDELDD